MIHERFHFLSAILFDAIAFGAMFTSLEFALKLLVAFSAAGYTLWKWRCDYVDRKSKMKHK